MAMNYDSVHIHYIICFQNILNILGLQLKQFPNFDPFILSFVISIKTLLFDDMFTSRRDCDYMECIDQRQIKFIYC